MAEFGDGFLNVHIGAIKGRVDEEEFDALTFQALAFAHAVAQGQRRPAEGPEVFLKDRDVSGDFVGG